MRFSEFTYQRPDTNLFKQQLQGLINQLTKAANAEVSRAVIQQINKLRKAYDTQVTVARIRFTANTIDKFYSEENDYFDQVSPEIENLTTDYYRALTNSAHRPQLENLLGKQLFNLAECAVKTISSEVLVDLQFENKLITEYTKVISSAKIEYQGKTYNLSGLVPLQMSTDRKVRQEVDRLRGQFFLDNTAQLDRIYDDLVKVRTNIAHKLGYQDFIGLAYDRMCRKDYGPVEVANYRDAIVKHIVPLASQLKQAQAKRISIPEMFYFDEALYFADGNPMPRGTVEEILVNANQMYDQLSPETGEFFKFMSGNELLDLLNRPNKRGGGYCTFIPQLQAPFIFANFNGTEGDITVLTHEAGHAFQAYMSRAVELPEYVFPTYEAAEIHSMSMEFLTWPWMEKFFGEQTAKFKYAHLTKALLFLPYGAMVDEFQHCVYAQPQLTPTERKQVWHDLEQKYVPHRNYGENEFLKTGGFWQAQSHIFQSPFYYIDYTLAQVCALTFWAQAQTDPQTAWQNYLELCRAGGSKSFLELVEIAGLQSPFAEKTIDQILQATTSWITANVISK